MQTFFQNCDEQIDGNGRPDLGMHRIGRRAVKSFDPLMLLEPFEEQFDLPAALKELGDGQSRHGEIIGQKDQGFAGERVTIADAAERGGISCCTAKPVSTTVWSKRRPVVLSTGRE